VAPTPRRTIVFAALALFVRTAAADVSFRVGDVTWTQTATTARLASSTAEREWAIVSTPTGGSVSTTRFGTPSGPNLVCAPSNAFTIGLGPIHVDSSQFGLSSLSAVPLPNGIKATFTFEPLLAAGLPVGVSIVREVALYVGGGVFEVTTKLHNASPLPLLLSSPVANRMRSRTV
jgi:hypothetical protein